MHTKLIRNLLIVFTVLLVFVSANIAVSAQEVNTEPLVADLSASSSTRYVFDPVNNGTDSYIVTGSNSDAEIIVNGSCDITLRNATFRRIEVDYSDSYDINITLEGTNTIDQYNWASQAALGIYSSNVVIFGGETDSLYANSKTFTAYSSSHDLGALTVEGGNITFRSFGGGAPFQTNYIQNGGNVTVIEEDYSQSFLYDVQLNGGSLEVINNRASSGAVFVGDVKLKNGVSLKVSVPNMPYLVSGLIGLADDAVADDCMFVRFDNSSDFVYLNDDNNALAGKSYFEIKVVDHTHICENGICYCGFICEHDTDGGTCGICGKYIYKIVHQPTEAEPYVQLNDGTNAVYKWYKTNYTEITDKSDILSWQIFGAPFPDSYSYSKTDGWTGIPLYYDEESGEQYIYYFVKNYNAGEEIVLNFSSPVIYLDLFNDEDYIEFEITGNVAKGVTENAGDYGLMVITDGSEPTLKAYVTDGVKTVIANETQAELIAPSYGSYYICEVTADDGSILISSILDFSYKITHQPTETETYVELNCSEDANYQWYRVTEDREYITNENADSFEILGAPPEIGGTYNEVDGWTPDEYGYYFVVWLNQGQNLTFDFSEIPSVIYCLYSSVAGDVEDELIIYSDTLIAQADGYYAIFVEESTAKLQACISNTRMDILNGQTGSKLTLNEIGNFLCEVTFKNGATEISETVAMTHIHTGGTATCVSPAVCQVCFQSYGSINTEAHNWDNGTITTTATCKVIGVKTYTCQHNSKHTYTENLGINASNHVDTKGTEAVSATCSSVGYTAGVFCNDCESYVSGHTEIGIDANAHKWDNGTITTTATCKVIGVKTYTCLHNSKHTYTEDLGLNASNHVDTKNTEAVEPTCSAAGYTAGVYCNDCESYISGHTEIGIDANAHKWDNGAITTTATCKEIGVKTYTCLHNSKHTYTEDLGLNASNHVDTKNTEAVEPTCSAAGYTAGVYCNDCESYISGHTEIGIDANAHKWDNGAITTTATCKEIGVKTYTCLHNSKHTYTEDLGLNASNHVYTKDTEAVTPTCSAAGYTAGVYCNDCESYISGHTEIGIDANAHKWDNGTITTTATCKVIGVKTYTCQHNSKHTYTENLGLNASNHINTVSTEAVAPTCSSVGYTAGVYCNDCENYISGHSEIGIDADAHKWDNGTITTTATCKVIGAKTYTCQHNSVHKKTEKLGVNASNHVSTKNVAEVKATCTAKGSTAGVYCNDCQKYISGHNEIAINPSNHVNTKTVPETPATFEKVGYTEGIYCNDCKKYILGHKEISVLMNIGDLDGNGTITAADARIALRASVGLENLSDSKILCADVDKNGKITASDARMILRASVGLETLGKSKKN